MGTRIAFVLTASLLFVACASDPVRPPHEGDRQSGPAGAGGGAGSVVVDGGSSPSSDDGGAGVCTDLTNTGVLVDENAVAGDFVGTGGAIVDGTYNIIEARVYLGSGGTGFPGPTNRSYRGTLRLNGTAYESVLVTQTAGNAGVEVHSRGTLTANATNIATLVLACPSATQEQFAYSVAGNGFTISNTASRVTFVLSKSL